MTVPNRQSGAYAYRNYSHSLVAQAVSVHVKNMCLVQVPTSACLFYISFYLFFVYVVLAQIILTEIVLVYY
jgi:hypothetical protein